MKAGLAGLPFDCGSNRIGAMTTSAFASSSSGRTWPKSGGRLPLIYLTQQITQPAPTRSAKWHGVLSPNADLQVERDWFSGRKWGSRKSMGVIRRPR